MLGLGNNLARGGVLGFSNTYSLDFDGTDDYVDVGTAYNGVKSISFLLKVDDVTSNTDYILGLNDTDYISVVDGTVTLSGFSGGTNTIYVDASEASTVDTAWHHILITSTTARNASNCDLGRTQSNNSYNMVGNLDEVAFTSDVKSASDFADGTTPLDISGLSNLQNWWRMGDGVLDDGNVTGNGLIADQVNPTLSAFVEDDCADDSISAGWDSLVTSDISFDTDHYDLTWTGNNNVGMDATIVANKIYKITCDIKIKTDWSGNLRFYNYNGDPSTGNSYGDSRKSEVNTSSYTTITEYLPSLGGGAGQIGFNVNTAGAISIKNFKAETVNGNPGLMTNMDAVDIVKDTP